MHQVSERRKMPRYSVSLNGLLKTLEKHCSRIKVSDISLSGLSLEINTEELPKIISNAIQDNRLSPISIRLEVDIGDQSSLLKIQCGIVYLQRKDINLSILGCRFESFSDDSSQRLENYLLKLDEKSKARLTQRDS
jgi:hypothetical protein